MLNLDTGILPHALADDLTADERRTLAKDQWSISGIVLWEIFKLQQIGRISLGVSDLEFQLMLTGVHVWPLDFQVFKPLPKLDFKNDPVDEIIAATSIAFNVPLVIRDKKIRKSKIVPLA